MLPIPQGKAYKLNALTLKKIEKQSCPLVVANIATITLEQTGRQMCQQRKT